MDLINDNLRNTNNIMNIGVNYKFLGVIDPQPFIDAVNKVETEEWTKDTWRQDVHRMHGSTQTIELIYDKDFKHFNTTKQKHWFDLGIEELMKPLLDLLNKEYGHGYIVRTVFVKLLAGRSVQKHIDTGGSYSLSHRIHVSLIADDDNVVYLVNNEEKKFKIGEVWEINNMVEHEVINKSEKDRINLLLDYATLDGKGWWWK